MSAEANATWWRCSCGYESVYAQQDRERRENAKKRAAAFLAAPVVREGQDTA